METRELKAIAYKEKDSKKIEMFAYTEEENFRGNKLFTLVTVFNSKGDIILKFQITEFNNGSANKYFNAEPFWRSYPEIFITGNTCSRKYNAIRGAVINNAKLYTTI